jgi:hypothetical protein
MTRLDKAILLEYGFGRPVGAIGVGLRACDFGYVKSSFGAEYARHEGRLRRVEKSKNESFDNVRVGIDTHFDECGMRLADDPEH